jgi:hypothetical protein
MSKEKYIVNSQIYEKQYLINIPQFDMIIHYEIYRALCWKNQGKILYSGCGRICKAIVKIWKNGDHRSG